MNMRLRIILSPSGDGTFSTVFDHPGGTVGYGKSYNLLLINNISINCNKENFFIMLEKMVSVLFVYLLIDKMTLHGSMYNHHCTKMLRYHVGMLHMLLFDNVRN